MNKLKLCLRYLDEHRTFFKTAVVALIMTIAVLFCTLNGEDRDNSENFSENLSEPSASAGVMTPDEEDASGAKQPSEIYVDIGGQVKHPGVYAVPPGTRLFEVIEKAGGLTEEAQMSQINQAEIVSDGQKIWIPSAEEGEEAGSAAGQSGQTADGRININTADSALLQEIPGVGPATAEKIIAYRQEHGAFAKPGDIQNVSGIGEKTYEKMKDKIAV